MFKGLTLTQPWCSLLAHGHKRIETRSWSHRYRGELAIHAAKSFPIDAREVCFTEPFVGVLRDLGVSFDAGDIWSTPKVDLPRGVIVAVAELVAIESTDSISRWERDNLLFGDWELPVPPYEHAFGNYAPNRWAWVLDDVRALAQPVPARGSLGLWDVPADVEARVREQLAGSVVS